MSKKNIDIDIDINLADISTNPGVYIYLDAKSVPLYIGKAKNLKSRISSYFNSNKKSITITKMLSKAKDIKTIITNNDVEAYLLEANLIKTEQPRYNILLKDSKTYPYVKLTNEKYARLLYTRQINLDDGDYYGPFVDVGDLRTLLDQLQRTFPLRTCTDRQFADGKYCIKYQIKRCLAPCVDYISLEDYQEIKENVKTFFKGNISEVKNKMTKMMQRYSSELKFEQAGNIRDILISFDRLFSKQSVININDNRSIDLFYKDTINDITSITQLFIRGGKLLSIRTQFFNDEIEELLEQFVVQYYNNLRQFPELVYIIGDDYSDGLEEVLSTLAKRKVLLRKRGYSGLIDIAKENAVKETELYLRNIARKNDVLLKLSSMLSIENIRRIECIDISHLSGDHTVGVSICSYDGEFLKSKYRKYRIKDATNDDYKSMYELFNRKFDNIEEKSEEQADLYIIDGGIGQLSVVSKLLSERKLSANIISISKSRKDKKNRFATEIDIEEVHLIGRKNPVKFKRNDNLLHFIKNIRDEAHRFAITYSRKLALNAITKSPLLEIEGLGIKRLKIILQTIPDIHSRKNLTKEELLDLVKIPNNLAEKIVIYLNQESS